MIINPSDVVAVPHGEWGKLRTCRWFFACTLKEDEKYILDEEEFDVTDLGDIFENESLKNLASHITNMFAEEKLRHEFDISHLNNISLEELNNICDKLTSMRNVIEKRVLAL